MSYNHPELIDLRRRAGIPTTPQTTPAYQKLNPEPLMVPMSQDDLAIVIAALQTIDRASEIKGYALLSKLKQIAGRVKKPEPYQKPNPLDPNNPYYQAQAEKGMAEES